MLGCLIEKERTTPQQYPLSLNALTLACNQSTNRDPVVAYGEEQVQAAVTALKKRGLARFVHPTHGRSALRFRHVVDEALGLDDRARSVLAVLLLRGPQTPGELRSRTERMAEFADVAGVESVLERLADRPEPLVRRLPGSRDRRRTATSTFSRSIDSGRSRCGRRRAVHAPPPPVAAAAACCRIGHREAVTEPPPAATRASGSGRGSAGRRGAGAAGRGRGAPTRRRGAAARASAPTRTPARGPRRLRRRRVRPRRRSGARPCAAGRGCRRGRAPRRAGRGGPRAARVHHPSRRDAPPSRSAPGPGTSRARTQNPASARALAGSRCRPTVTPPCSHDHADDPPPPRSRARTRTRARPGTSPGWRRRRPPGAGHGGCPGADGLVVGHAPAWPTSPGWAGMGAIRARSGTRGRAR